MWSLVLLLTMGTASDLNVELKGEVRVMKAGPTTRSVLESGGKNYVLTTYDPHTAEELRRLGGAVIRVQGVKSEASLPPGDQLLVRSYRIMDVGDGRIPEVGTVARMAGSDQLLFVQDSGLAHRLPDSWSRRMKKLVGAKLWLLGEVTDDRMRPIRFQVLRSPPSPEEEEPTSPNPTRR